MLPEVDQNDARALFDEVSRVGCFAAVPDEYLDAAPLTRAYCAELLRISGKEKHPQPCVQVSPAIDNDRVLVCLS